MARCYICGKEISVFDSTTSYYDSTGARVEVHTACKAQQQAQEQAQGYTEAFQAAGPQLYAPEMTQDAAAAGVSASGSSDQALGPLGISKTVWYIGGGIAALAVLGVIIGATR